VAPAPALVRLVLVGEATDLLTLGLGHHLRRDRRPLELLGARHDRVAVDEHDRPQRHLGLGLRAEELDLEALAGLDPVLLAAGGDDCVHDSSRVQWRRSVEGNGTG
jgi:hypothetical protein